MLISKMGLGLRLLPPPPPKKKKKEKKGTYKCKTKRNNLESPFKDHLKMVGHYQKQWLVIAFGVST